MRFAIDSLRPLQRLGFSDESFISLRHDTPPCIEVVTFLQVEHECHFIMSRAFQFAKHLIHDFAAAVSFYAELVNLRVRISVSAPFNVAV